jgi:polyphosphate:AMP phosphotransferase
MFEAFELGRTLSKEDFDAQEGPLREALLEAQMDLKNSRKFGVVVIIGGVKGAGKRETVGVLNSWMDPRYIDTLGLREPSDEERERPPMWRFWRMLPPKGRIALFHGSWHTMPIVDRAFKRISAARMEREMDRIRDFETMLVHEGVLVLKFWMHLAKDLQKKRMRAIEKDPLTSWRITHQDWENFERYDTFRKVSARAIQLTSTAEAPWTLVEATDPRHQVITVGRHILENLRARLDEARPTVPLIHIPPVRKVAEEVNPLRTLDLTGKLEKKAYETELERWQGDLARLTRTKAFQKRSLVCVFEGMDAAGKGGGIRRVVAALDAGRVKVVPVAAPTEEERAQPYLWRFWRQLPRAGSATLFDRSWYGRVLVERVEGFAQDADWMRAFEEINAFEDQMHRHGTVVCKFWLHVSQDEQLRRFEARAETAFKRFKITDEDWRNREKWPQYEAAICDMLERTSTEEIPWTLVPAEDKYFGRVLILRTLVERLKAALEG